MREDIPKKNSKGLEALAHASRSQRIRMLREEPHSQKAAEAAVGLGTDNGKRSEKAQEDTAMEITESN